VTPFENGLASFPPHQHWLNFGALLVFLLKLLKFSLLRPLKDGDVNWDRPLLK